MTNQVERRRRPRGAVREALVEAGLATARAEGPAAVVLRAATRAAGVSPNAAYRHFADRDDLLRAVAARCQERMAALMQTRLDEAGPLPGPDGAWQRLRTAGRAYVEFALTEPGWFATAFAIPQRHDYDAPEDGSGPDRSPLGDFRAVLDELVNAGMLARQRRDGIEYPIWSTVHGLAVLTTQGPLRDVPDITRRRIEQFTSSFIGSGLS